MSSASGSTGKLTGQVVVIFGGSSGMGKAAAKAVHAAGGTPWLVGRNLEKLEATRAEISPETKVSSVDCFNEEAVKIFFEGIEVNERFLDFSELTFMPGWIHSPPCNDSGRERWCERYSR